MNSWPDGCKNKDLDCEKKKKKNFKTRYKTNKLLLFSAKSCLTLWDPK